MYLLVFEDCSIKKQKSVSNEDLQASVDAIVDIVDISNPEYPLIYIDEGWTDVDE